MCLTTAHERGHVGVIITCTFYTELLKLRELK